uniref:Ras-associating domain-containing protein n=1 Tax=Felis catus TaxID=9685 RepID=A0ABI7WXT8_FELCA
MKEDCPPSSHVPISDSKSILKSELLSLLKTYNCYHEGRSFQLRHREEEGALIIEGLLNIAWGLRRPIRLQIQDDRERVHLSAASWTPGQPSCHLKEPLLQEGKVAAQEPNAQTAHSTESSRDSSEPVEEDEETPQLMRTKSDAACVIQRRPRSRTPGEAQRIRRHRFSINGHFYNHKTSVFTPAYGSVTNVRVNSTMTTLHVLTLLLNKFRVENGPSEFALYIVHESGGKCLPVLPDHENKSRCPFGRLTGHAAWAGGHDEYLCQAETQPPSLCLSESQGKSPSPAPLSWEGLGDVCRGPGVGAEGSPPSTFAEPAWPSVQHWPPHGHSALSASPSAPVPL